MCMANAVSVHRAAPCGTAAVHDFCIETRVPLQAAHAMNIVAVTVAINTAVLHTDHCSAAMLQSVRHVLCPVSTDAAMLREKRCRNYR
jgi:hypothetical protein